MTFAEAFLFTFATIATATLILWILQKVYDGAKSLGKAFMHGYRDAKSRRV